MVDWEIGSGTFGGDMVRSRVAKLLSIMLIFPSRAVEYRAARRLVSQRSEIPGGGPAAPRPALAGPLAAEIKLQARHVAAMATRPIRNSKKGLPRTFRLCRDSPERGASAHAARKSKNYREARFYS